eukprot:TRINITY_DN185029_c0_g1_i1.p1 TRINITY_DN185029_c0_g1~~TRINITY_DN185029_c0_g1_i1.p1  ORF type:complete len:117 (-),score=24.56 TRINITY_DN185029_c0_g1_i1:32-382(-)
MCIRDRRERERERRTNKQTDRQRNREKETCAPCSLLLHALSLLLHAKLCMCPQGAASNGAEHYYRHVPLHYVTSSLARVSRQGLSVIFTPSLNCRQTAYIPQLSDLLSCHTSITLL